MKRARELPLHIAVAQMLRLCAPVDLLWSHFPAGEQRPLRAAQKLKAMGLKAGWSDFLFCLPDGRFAAVELKAEKGRLTEAQEAFKQAVLSASGCHAVCRSVDEVRSALDEWGVLLRGRVAA